MGVGLGRWVWLASRVRRLVVWWVEAVAGGPPSRGGASQDPKARGPLPFRRGGKVAGLQPSPGLASRGFPRVRGLDGAFPDGSGVSRVGRVVPAPSGVSRVGRECPGHSGVSRVGRESPGHPGVHLGGSQVGSSATWN